jgi:hypothetical protein
MKNLNGPPKFSKILHEKYKSILFVFSDPPPKNFFRRPAAGGLAKSMKITMYDYLSGNHTGYFGLVYRSGGLRPPKKFLENTIL